MKVEHIHFYESFFSLQVNSYNALLKIGCNIIIVVTIGEKYNTKRWIVKTENCITVPHCKMCEFIYLFRSK